MAEDPALLTVAKLKAALTARNVKFKENQLKKYYVDLYNAEVLPRLEKSDAPAEQAIRRKPSPARRRRTTAAPQPTERKEETPPAQERLPEVRGSPGVRILAIHSIRSPRPAESLPEAKPAPSPPRAAPAPAVVPQPPEQAQPLEAPAAPEAVLPRRAERERPAEEPRPAKRDYSAARFVGIVLLEVAVLLLLLQFGLPYLHLLHLPSWWKPYCDTAQAPLDGSCLPCPYLATCVDGKATCSAGYVLEGRDCVEDERLVRDMHRAAEALRYQLQKLKGQAECASPPGDAHLATEAARALVEGTTTTPGVWAKLTEKASDYSLLQEASGWTTAEPAVKPWSCQLTELITANIPYVVAALGVLLLLAYLRMVIVRRSQEQEMVLDMLTQVLTELANAPGYHHGVAQMRDHVAPRNSRAARLWPRVVEAIELDSRVAKAQHVLPGGVQSATWQWVAGPLSPRRPYH